MATLGLVIIWAAYTSGIFGWSKIKTASGAAKLSLSDLALPSHRGAYISAADTWSSSTGGGGTPGGSPLYTPVPANTPSTEPTNPNGTPNLSGLGTGVVGPGVVVPIPSPTAMPSGPFTPAQ